MAQVLVRDLDPEVVELIRESARRHNRSLEAELRRILEAEARRLDTDFWKVADRLRRSIPDRQRTDSTDLIRADRER